MRRTIVRAGIALATTVALVAGLAGQASAHVTIDSLGSAEQGGFAKVVFSVPNERDDASTVKVSVQMPKDHPLPFVSAAPKPGWEISTTTRTLDTPLEMFGTTYDTVIDTVTWTATGDSKIAAGQFDQFWLSVGALPTDATTVEFPAIQTYDSGEEVAWIEPTPAGGEEPEHPVPTLNLVAATGEGEPSTVATPDDDSNALSIIALVVGALGLVVGGAAFATRKRTASAPAS